MFSLRHLCAGNSNFTEHNSSTLDVSIIFSLLTLRCLSWYHWRGQPEPVLLERKKSIGQIYPRKSLIGGHGN